MGEEQSANSYVYFIHAPSVKRMKIGYAVSPDVRFVEINVGSPVPLVKFALMCGPQSMEGELHRKFAKHRKKGEWFSTHPSLMEFIAVNAYDWAEHMRERREIGEREGQIEAEAQVQAMREAYGEIRRFQDTCWINGLDPTKHTTAELQEKLREKSLKRARRRRFGPLQKMLDDLKATGG